MSIKLRTIVILIIFFCVFIPFQATFKIVADEPPTALPPFPTSLPVISAKNAANVTLLADLEDEKQGLWIMDVAYSPDSKTLATIDDFGVIAIYDAKTATKIKIIAPPNEPDSRTRNTLLFSSDGLLLASTSDTDIFVWNAKDLTAKGKIEPKYWWHGNTLPASGIVFSPDNKQLVSGTQNPNEAYSGLKATLYFWNMATGQHKPIETQSFYASPYVYSPDGKILIYALEDGYHLLDTDTEKNTSLIAHPSSEDRASHLIFAPDGTLLNIQTTFIGIMAQKIELVEQETGKVRQIFKKSERIIGVFLTFNKDFSIMVTGDPTEAGFGMVFWDVKTGQQIGGVVGAGAISSVAFNPDGTQLAVGQEGAGAALAYAHIWGVRP